MKALTRYTLLAMLLLAAAGLQAKELFYYVDYSNFYDASGKPYTEVYLDIDAGSVGYMQVEGGYQGAVEVRLEVKDKSKKASDPAVFDRTFELLSPMLRDTTVENTRFGIMDVRRIGLEPGVYELTGYLRDKVRPGAPQHMFVMDIILKEQKSGFMTLSDIEFVQSVKPTAETMPHSKLGLDVLPLVTNGTFQDVDSLRFYMETYHADLESEGAYFVNAYITLANSTTRIKNLQRTIRQSSKPLDVVFSSFDISQLPTQTYYLNIDIYNKEQKVIENVSRKFFVVNTSMEMETGINASAFDEVFNLNDEDLNYYLRTLYYISTNTERDFAEALTTMDEKKNYFFNFWENRKGNSGSPVKAWMEYKARVDYANQHFKASHLEGWRTDRGRVLLTYGSPNDIERHPSSNDRHPYDVWRYNRLKTQSNLRFIFFNPNEATAEYVLIHSDLRGELNNPRYEFQLVRTATDANLDNDNIQGQWK